MIMSALERVESLRTRNQNNIKSINKDLYRLICNKDLLGMISINKKSSPGIKESNKDVKNRYDQCSALHFEKTINELKEKSFEYVSKKTRTSKKKTKL